MKGMSKSLGLHISIALLLSSRICVLASSDAGFDSMTGMPNHVPHIFWIPGSWQNARLWFAGLLRSQDHKRVLLEIHQGDGTKTAAQRGGVVAPRWPLPLSEVADDAPAELFSEIQRRRAVVIRTEAVSWNRMRFLCISSRSRDQLSSCSLIPVACSL